MITSEFQFKAPQTIKELFKELHTHRDVAILSGGHSLIGLLKSGAINPDAIISVDRIDSLKLINEKDDGAVEIGSSVSLATLLDHHSIGRTFPALKKAIGTIGNRQYCNQTSIGDEFSYASSSMGVLAVLLSHGATFEFSNGKEAMTVSHPEQKPKQSVLTAIHLQKYQGSVFVQEVTDPVSRLPLCGIATMISGNPSQVQAENFIVYGREIIPSRLPAVETHIQEARSATSIDPKIVGKALTPAIKNSSANPDYLTNLVCSFTKKAMQQVN
jgi:CO/xanthine dehydrogenase FAD-binding subunit